MNDIGTQTIQTRRLALRRFTVDDAEAMFANWANDPLVTRYLTWAPHENVDATRALLQCWVADYEKFDNYQWAIVYEGQVIGSIAVVELKRSAQVAEIGYCIGKAWWHKGIMTEALGAVIDHLFAHVGVNCVCARHDTNNPHSGDVMKKCGMTCDGILRQYAHNRQGICDVAHYSILKGEWRA